MAIDIDNIYINLGLFPFRLLGCQSSASQVEDSGLIIRVISFEVTEHR